MSTEAVAGNIVGNVYDKYGTKNPLARVMMRGFLNAVIEFSVRCQPRTVLEVGCGEGKLANHLLNTGLKVHQFVACDLELSRLADGLHPSLQFRTASIYDLPFEDASFDLVLCCEVLEHLEDPERGLRELVRVARQHLIVSTPREPLWRGLNVLRGKYVSDWGNTPGHIQHFGRNALRRLVQRQADVVESRSPIPWTVLLARPRAVLGGAAR